MPRRKLVIVDDNDELVAMLVRAAVERGYDATGVADASEGLRRVRALRPDVVLLDLRMPGLDGRDLLARLKSDPSVGETTVIVLTGMSDSHTRELCLAYGAADFVSKPIDLEDLFRRVAALPRRLHPLVLIVEDDRDQRSSLRDLVRVAGYTVGAARDGTRALRIARAHRPRIVLLDWQLGASPMGRALVDELRLACGADVRIFVLSADPAAARESEGLGVAGFVRKPFEIGALLRVLSPS